jgi:tRNA-dihydrouridine synthase B
MRDPDHAAAIIEAMARSVKIPVTVKMRAGWNEQERNAPALARRVEQAGAAAIAVHGRTAAQSYSGQADWRLVEEIASRLSIPVFGSGDCVEPDQVVERRRAGVAGVLVGRGVLRNPWILAQARDLEAGRPLRAPTRAERGRFLLSYIELLQDERLREPDGFRHAAPGVSSPAADRQQASHDRWVINKIRALATYYTKGFEQGAQLRMQINGVDSIAGLQEIIDQFFGRITEPSAATA